MTELCGVCEDASGMVRKSKTFMQSAVQLALTLMLEVEDDEDWCKKPDVQFHTHIHEPGTHMLTHTHTRTHTQSPDGSDDPVFECGELSIDRLGDAIGAVICCDAMDVLGRSADTFFLLQASANSFL